MEMDSEWKQYKFPSILSQLQEFVTQDILCNSEPTYFNLPNAMKVY